MTAFIGLTLSGAIASAREQGLPFVASLLAEDGYVYGYPCRTEGEGRNWITMNRVWLPGSCGVVRRTPVHSNQ